MRRQRPFPASCCKHCRAARLLSMHTAHIDLWRLHSPCGVLFCYPAHCHVRMCCLLVTVAMLNRRDMWQTCTCTCSSSHTCMHAQAWFLVSSMPTKAPRCVRLVLAMLCHMSWLPSSGSHSQLFRKAPCLCSILGVAQTCECAGRLPPQAVLPKQLREALLAVSGFCCKLEPADLLLGSRDC